ncbi:MAG: hypothetical protein ACI4OU_06005, partial [Candidatus Enterenecus sp.]
GEHESQNRAHQAEPEQVISHFTLQLLFWFDFFPSSKHLSLMLILHKRKKYCKKGRAIFLPQKKI